MDLMEGVGRCHLAHASCIQSRQFDDAAITTVHHMLLHHVAYSTSRDGGTRKTFSYYISLLKGSKLKDITACRHDHLPGGLWCCDATACFYVLTCVCVAVKFGFVFAFFFLFSFFFV